MSGTPGLRMVHGVRCTKVGRSGKYSKGYRVTKEALSQKIG